MNKNYRYILLLAGASLLAGSCKKFVEIEAPRGTVSTATLFMDSTGASNALLGIYSKMSTGLSTLPNFGSGSITIFTGQSSDELTVTGTGDQSIAQNLIAVDNGSLQIWWKDAYFFIYQANTCLEGLEASQTIEAGVKKQFIAEAKFIRAFMYFYVASLWGDVPYITSSDWTKTFGSGRTPVATVYNNVVQDLLTAQSDLPATYPAAGKIRPIGLSAMALLARVYLYQGDWAKAAAAASAVINSGVYPKLLPAAAIAFLKNNDEAIWQLMPVNPTFNTWDGAMFIPSSVTTTPAYVLTASLTNSFEAGDLRFTNWVNAGTGFNYAFKYKARTTATNGGLVTEYNSILRLAEQYLIRAEAEAHQSDIIGAVNDLNVVRKRAGLPNLVTTLTQDQCYTAIEKERRSELFCEWGHRWLDLKRTGRADAVLAPLKPTWKPTAVLYPIPLSELQKDPSLTQNSGY